MRTVIARLENLRQEIRELSAEEKNPFDLHYRIKDFDSVVEKCQRKGYELSMESIQKHILDVAGVRVITDFRDEIYTTKAAIIRQPSMTIVEETDYVQTPKVNGYQSLHLDAEMDIYFAETSKRVPVEIQIRTKAMDLWASMEHILRYKNPSPSPDVEEMFKRSAEELATFDSSAMNLRDFNDSDAAQKNSEV